MVLQFNLIVARCENHGIGYKGRLPWSLKKEMAHFTRLTKEVCDPTKRNAVIMGRLTWESLPGNRKVLPERLNIVLSTQKLELTDAIHCTSFLHVQELLESPEYVDKIETAWIIGGSQVYDGAIKNKLCDRIYLTRILHEYPCDAYVNLNLSRFREISDPRVPKGIQTEEGVMYDFKVYDKMHDGEKEE